jgi:hypothetical protein
MGEFVICSNGYVGCGVIWHDDRGGEPRKCVGDAFIGGRPYPDYVAMIVPQGWAEIPSCDGMWGPRATSRGFLMDEDLRSGRGKRSVIEVESTVDLGLGGQLWIDPGSPQQIESEETWGGSQIFSGKSGLVEHSPAMKWFLKVCMVRSEALRRWTWGGANWKSMSEVSRNSCNAPVASFSRHCSRCLKPLDWRKVILRWYA